MPAELKRLMRFVEGAAREAIRRRPGALGRVRKAPHAEIGGADACKQAVAFNGVFGALSSLGVAQGGGAKALRASPGPRLQRISALRHAPCRLGRWAPPGPGGSLAPSSANAAGQESAARHWPTAAGHHKASTALRASRENVWRELGEIKGADPASTLPCIEALKSKARSRDSTCKGRKQANIRRRSKSSSART